MATTQDWVASGFAAFAGPAVLNANFMAKTMNNGVEDVLADVLRFYRWIEDLRANVGPNAGIPTEYVASVQALLTAFFPQMQPNNVWKPAVRIRSVNQAGIVAVESLVDFGTHTPKNQLRIVDAPTALGYIFSVAIPPANPTWLNYYLPLAALYCRCLYLAFIRDRVSDTDLTIVEAVADLPIMSCVMYNGPNQNIRYVYGSTPAKITGGIPSKLAERTNAASMLDRFRRQNVLEPALLLANPNSRVPLYSPRRINDLATKLWSQLKDTAEFDSDVDPLRTTAQNLQTAVINIYEMLPQYQPGTLQALPLNKVFGHAVWKEALMVDLRTIVRDRFFNAAAYNRNNLGQAVVAAWRGVIKTYIAPHIYTKLDTAFALQIVDPASQAAVDQTVGQALGNLWQGFSTSFLNELDNLHQQQINKPDHTPFGRCAETYCVIGMQPHYFQNETMNGIRGISLSIPAVGGSNSFQTGFGTPQLGNATPKGAYRLPCINCQELLPLYGCVMGQANYDTDIWAAPDKNNPPY